VEARAQHWISAKEAYTKSAQAYMDLKARGLLREEDARDLDFVSRQAAKCEEMIASARVAR
jgi:hypothetical protein